MRSGYDTTPSGQRLSGFVPPLPWEIDETPSQSFKEEVRLIEVPHTACTKTCHRCKGTGEKMTRFINPDTKLHWMFPKGELFAAIAMAKDGSGAYIATEMVGCLIRVDTGRDAFTVSIQGVSPIKFETNSISKKMWFTFRNGHGHGHKDCHKCNSKGKVNCQTCEGYGQIRCFIQLSITWKVWKDFHGLKKFIVFMKTNILK